MPEILHTEITGRGAPLVLLHGWAVNRHVFEDLVARLSPRFEVHSVDLTGHGDSAGIGCDSDPGADEFSGWMARDPLKRLASGIERAGNGAGGQLEAIDAEVEDELDPGARGVLAAPDRAVRDRRSPFTTIPHAHDSVSARAVPGWAERLVALTRAGSFIHSGRAYTMGIITFFRNAGRPVRR